MDLNDIHRGVQRRRKRKRIGRGVGSGLGKTAGRGHKGAKSRSGYSRKPVFQGGAMPLVRRVPKRGFNNPFALNVTTINVGDLDRVFNDGDEITPETLKQRALIPRKFDLLKILGDGEVSKKLTVSAHRFSKTAREKLEKAGGRVEVLPGKTPVAEKQKQKAEAAAS